MAIQTMAKSEYNTENSHYGLEIYTHFTSPIRRYADVMVGLGGALGPDGKGSADGIVRFRWKCHHSSTMEKRAAEAERASII